MAAFEEPGFSLVSIPAASTAIQDGNVLELPKPCKTHTAVCTATASTATGVVWLELSQDGVNWFQTAVTVTASTVTVTTVTGAFSFVRASITTAFTAGSVEVTVASAA